MPTTNPTSTASTGHMLPRAPVLPQVAPRAAVMGVEETATGAGVVAGAVRVAVVEEAVPEGVLEAVPAAVAVATEGDNCSL